MNDIFALLLIFIAFGPTTGQSETTEQSTTGQSTTGQYVTTEPVPTEMMFGTAWPTVPTGGYPPDCCPFKTVTGQICNDLP